MQTRQGAKGLWVLAVAVVLGAGQQAHGQQGKSWITLKGHTTEPVQSLAFSPDGKLLASDGDDQSANLWDVQTGRERATLKHLDRTPALAFAPNGQLLASGGRKGEVRLWDAAGRPRGTLEGTHGTVECLAFSPDSTTLVVGGGWEDRKGHLRLWNVRTGYAHPALRGHTGVVIEVSFSEDGRMLAAGDAGGVVTVWEVASGKVRTSFRGHRGCISSVVFVHRTLLASGGEDGTVRFWDLRSGKQRAAFSRHGGYVSHLAVAGELLASTGRDGNVLLWNTATRMPLLTIGLDDWNQSVAFSPDGKFLAAGDAVGTIRVWSVPKLLAQIRKKEVPRPRLEGRR